MRVIAGKYRRTTLYTLQGKSTRPTADRIKETLFNIINDDVYESDFLDLFAGSGQIGIEALSRYASSVTFVDSKRESADCINANLERCHTPENAEVICGNAINTLKRFPDNSFDIIFMDPPYKSGYEEDILKFLSESDVIRDNGLVITEADINNDFTYTKSLNFELVQDKKYKNNRHLILRKIHK